MPVEIQGAQYFTNSEVSEELGVSRQTLWRWREKGRIPTGLRWNQSFWTSRCSSSGRRYTHVPLWWKTADFPFADASGVVASSLLGNPGPSVSLPALHYHFGHTRVGFQNGLEIRRWFGLRCRYRGCERQSGDSFGHVPCPADCLGTASGLGGMLNYYYRKAV